jgi:predicted CXXCH cytochrome family protein
MQKSVKIPQSAFLAALLLAVFAAAPTPAHAATYAGSDNCKSCHEKEYSLWKSSHHYQAMQVASDETVLGDFSDSEFDYAGTHSRFYKKDGKFFVETDNEKGELQEFEIRYTFGFYPLQQYLVPFPNGRYQALNIVWDSRVETEGGQRWVHLYPDEEISHQDVLHWTGSFQNWNSRCATCHSTGLRKNYNSTSNSYQTNWAEINLGCEACHGPASDHLEWVADTGKDRSKSEHAAFSFSLADRGPWGPGKPGTPGTLTRLDGKHPQGQIGMCAACHSRRSEMSEEHAGKAFDDLFQLRLLEDGYYFPDGQIFEEVYVYGSFLQSKMAQSGVVCSNCHDAHSNRVLAEDNSLCTQCHDNKAYNDTAHHHHPEQSSGSSCVNCHMPVKAFMVVDDRHDHSFRVPEPRLTLELGTPNTCTQCHQDKDARWALTALENWGVSSEIRARHAPILARGRQGDASVLPDLMALANDPVTPGIIKATAVLEIGSFPSLEAMQAMQQHLNSEDQMVRAAAVRSLGFLPVAQRYQMLQPLITDPVKLVRMEAASQLTEFPHDQLPPKYAQEITTLMDEFLETLRLNADMPEAQMNLGNYYTATGDGLNAEKAYRQALKLSPAFTPALLNLADLYRANGLDIQAASLLQKAVTQSPDDPATHHAMGLLQVRQKNMDEAVSFLEKAAELDPANVRYSYVYAVALYENKRFQQAISVLEATLQKQPGNQDIVSALGSYYQQQGEDKKLQALTRKYVQ